MSDQTRDDKIDELIAGQAKTDGRFIELFRRLDKAETAAAEARDIAKEISVILREQNALARVAEVKAEAHNLIEGLRSDMVLAHKNLREPQQKMDGRLSALEEARSQGRGMARGVRWLIEGGKLVAAALGGGLLAKFIRLWAV